MLRVLFISLLSVFALSVQAETGSQPTKLSASRRPKKEEEAALLFSFKTRPTWFQNNPSFRMENSLEAGVKLGPNLSISYNQDFITNQGKNGIGEAFDFTPALQDGYFRLRINKIAEWEGVTFHDQIRVYMPTMIEKQMAGMVTAVRNYFVFSRSLSPEVTFTLYEVPIIHVYDRAGSFDLQGAARANPIFENRIILEFGVRLVKGLTFTLPVMLQSVLFLDFPGAENSANWAPAFSFMPELELSLTDHTSVGVYYETGNLLKQEYYGLTLGDGLTTGYAQFYFAVLF